MKNEDYKFVCSECKGENVEQRHWVDVNTDKVLSSCYEGDDDDNWCRDCEEHVSFDVVKVKKVKQ